MLDNLLEIEVAYSLLKGGDEGEDPIDAHYKKLKTSIKVDIGFHSKLEKTSCHGIETLFSKRFQNQHFSTKKKKKKKCFWNKIYSQK